MKKGKKTDFRRNSIIPKPVKIVISKFDTTILNPTFTLC